MDLIRNAALLFGLCLAAAAQAEPILPRTPPAFVPVHYGHDALAAIEAARMLRCGVITAAEDYSMASTHGNLSAFGADLCRAVAAALLGAPDAAVVSGYPDDAHGLRALHENKIDLLFGVTPDAASALPYDVAFAPTALFDGQGFLVARASGITNPAQLTGKQLCFITGTSAETRMNAWGAAAGVKFWAHDFQERGEMATALEAGECAAITEDVTALAEIRAGFSKPAREYAILPQLIAIDPWAPALRASEVRLNAVVTDVMAALIQGEALGITAASTPPGADLLLGATPGIATTLGMANGWARRAIAVTGNYGQIFDHDLGDGSDYGLARGPDALWTNGGMLAPPTVR